MMPLSRMTVFVIRDLSMADLLAAKFGNPSCEFRERPFVGKCYPGITTDMSIELSSELEQLVQHKLASGRYQSVAEVLTDALGLLEERDLYTVVHGEEIGRRIGQGYESLRAGRGVDGDSVFERIERELTEMEPGQA